MSKLQKALTQSFVTERSEIRAHPGFYFQTLGHK
uniref:Uncharacterized protein n=1 Tax=Anguilla anguilla TaxID=7936 RepID=A0A0E9V8U9_ANGAN